VLDAVATVFRRTILVCVVLAALVLKDVKDVTAGSTHVDSAARMEMSLK